MLSNQKENIMKFQFHALKNTLFEQYYDMTDEQLEASGIVKYVADADSKYPCRVTLEDAKQGETLYLLNYTHLDVSTPYRSTHAIFVRNQSSPKKIQPGKVPDIIKNRSLLSVRGFDKEGMMTKAEVTSGEQVGELVSMYLNEQSCEYIHVHTARQGCFLASATRCPTLT